MKKVSVPIVSYWEYRSIPLGLNGVRD